MLYCCSKGGFGLLVIGDYLNLGVRYSRRLEAKATRTVPMGARLDFLLSFILWLHVMQMIGTISGYSGYDVWWGILPY